MAFVVAFGVGLRSLAAAVFPLAIALYFDYVARLQVPARDSRAPIINNFVIFLLWTLIVLGVDGTNDLTQFPLEELLYASTIAALIFRYKLRDSFKDLLACCYGILTGALGAIILFGWNPATL